MRPCKLSTPWGHPRHQDLQCHLPLTSLSTGTQNRAKCDHIPAVLAIPWCEEPQWVKVDLVGQIWLITLCHCPVFRQQSPPWPPPQAQPNTTITNTTTATTTRTTTATTTAKPIPQQLLPMNSKALCHSSDLSQALIAASSLRHSSPREGSKHIL